MLHNTGKRMHNTHVEVKEKKIAFLNIDLY